MAESELHLTLKLYFNSKVLCDRICKIHVKIEKVQVEQDL